MDSVDELKEIDMRHWVEQARQHWKEFQPEKYARLMAAGTLNQELEAAAEATQEQMQTLLGQGFNRQEAWEQVREQYLFPPEEEGIEEERPEPSPGYLNMMDLNETLASLDMPGTP